MAKRQRSGIGSSDGTNKKSCDSSASMFIINSDYIGLINHSI